MSRRKELLALIITILLPILFVIVMDCYVFDDCGQTVNAPKTITERISVYKE